MNSNLPQPPFKEQQQPTPGNSAAMVPQPDYGETSYQGSGRLAGKKAIITGADSGIGRAVALAYARESADVLVSYYDEHDDARETQRLVESAGRRCVLMPGDIKDPEHCRAIVSKAVAVFGRIDILVNNAAHQASFSSIEDISDDEWDVTFRTNIHAMFYLTKAVVPHMKGGGSIINTASFVALLGAATPQIADTASKGAVLALSRELAVIHARENIRVNALCPGPLRTELLMSYLNTDEKKQRRLVHVPMGRFGEAKEIAQAALFLASDESSYITGTDFLVDGGITGAYVTPE